MKQLTRNKYLILYNLLKITELEFFIKKVIYIDYFGVYNSE